MNQKKYRREDFARACELYEEWNAKINVISRKDIDSVFEHHFLHSFSIFEYLISRGEPTEGLDILDVGTGGGFPGVPLAMIMPSCRFTLCDSIGKKVKVAQSVSDGLGLKNVTCVNARVESLDGEYDYVVSRAVTSLVNFYPWVKGKYKKSILYLKGGDVLEEISELCRKFGLSASQITAWPISNWLSDDYFAEKFVIEIRK